MYNSAHLSDICSCFLTEKTFHVGKQKFTWSFTASFYAKRSSRHILLTTISVVSTIWTFNVKFSPDQKKQGSKVYLCP